MLLCRFHLEAASIDCEACPDALDCNDDEKCQGPGGVGDSCEFEVDCREGLVCGIVDSEMRCAEPLDDGEPCIAASQCESRYCDEMGECAADPAGCWMAYGWIGYDSCEP